jgi:hypothetical protein
MEVAVVVGAAAAHLLPHNFHILLRILQVLILCFQRAVALVVVVVAVLE